MYKGGEKPYEHYQQTYKKVFNHEVLATMTSDWLIQVLVKFQCNEHQPLTQQHSRVLTISITSLTSISGTNNLSQNSQSLGKKKGLTPKFTHSCCCLKLQSQKCCDPNQTLTFLAFVAINTTSFLFPFISSTSFSLETNLNGTKQLL